MKLYKDFTSQIQIDEQYNAGASVADYSKWMQWYRSSSQKYQATANHSIEAYGPTLSESLQIYPATESGAPLVVFIHGGYWRAGAASDFAFVARGLGGAGCTVAVIDYALCPSVTIDEITRQTRAAVSWLYRNASRFNADSGRIVVAGHSAGGQQVGMLLQTDWSGQYGLPDNLVSAAVAISGLYDLRPLRYSYLQPMLNLTHETIHSQSPVLQPLRLSDARILLTLGGLESEEFHCQSRAYLDYAAGVGLDVELWVQDGRHHFDAIEGLFDVDSELMAKIKTILPS